MQRLAQEGRTIVCVIHQPSSSIFEMFDQLYLLAKGHCIYQGPTTDVITFVSEITGTICPIHHSAVIQLLKLDCELIFLSKSLCIIQQADYGIVLRC